MTSIRETLDLLDTSFAGLAAGITEDRYVFWLGSGISFGRVPGLEAIILHLLDFLQQHVETSGDPCPYRAALDEILGMTALTAAQKDAINYDRPIADWGDLEPVAKALVSSYARILGVTVGDQDSDYLLWNAIDVRARYGDPALEPDTEHLCIAILVLEGVASEIASANWDGLVERAVERLHGNQALVICVCDQDLRYAQLSGSLYKFHGCAVRAIADEAEYRKRLVARQPQIDSYTADPTDPLMLAHLVDLIAQKRTLMMGLSAQDSNIKNIFIQAKAKLNWEWPSDLPAYIFAEEELGFDQKSLLESVYRDFFNAETRGDILASALLKAYAKPLLVALVLYVLCAKMQTLVKMGLACMPRSEQQKLAVGVIAMRNAAADAVGPTPPEGFAFVERLVVETARLMTVFHEGRLRAPGEHTYCPITDIPVQKMLLLEGLEYSGLPQLAIALALLGLGLRAGDWTMTVPGAANPAGSVVDVTAKSGPVHLFFVKDQYAALKLQRDGHIRNDDPIIVVHSKEIISPLPRSPLGRFGRKGKRVRRDIAIETLLINATTSSDALHRFRAATSI